MSSFLLRDLRLFGILLSVLVGSRFVCAQEIGYGGVGPINMSMAGAGVAFPLDAAGAISWNPASIGALEKSEFSFGLTRGNAPWYGDETIGAVGVGLLWLLFETGATHDTMRGTYTGNKTSNVNGHSQSDGNSTVNWLNRNAVRVPSLAYVYHPEGKDWAWGIGISEAGMRRLRLLTDPGDESEIVALAAYRTKGFEILPSLSWGRKERLYFGLSPVFTIDEFPTGSLPIVPGAEMLHRSRSRFGFGVQLGVFLKTKPGWNFGFSVRSPQWISDSRLEWIDPTTGSRERRRVDYAQDWPLRIVFGIAYTGLEHFSFAFDVRYYDFSHSRSLFTIAGRRPRTESLASYALGIQWKPAPPLAVRLGYQFNDGANDLEDYLNNTTVVIQRGHSIHYGITLGNTDETFDLTVAFSHGFGDGRVRFETVDGMQSFGGNPNDSTFAIGFRVRK